MRRLIEDSISADGIEILVREVSIFSGDFEKKLAALKGDEAKASEMEHGIRHEIHVRLEEDPAYYRSLRERLEKIIADRKAQRIDAARQLELFEALAKDVKNPADVAEEAGLSATAFAIYGVLAGGGHDGVRETAVDYGELDTTKVASAQTIEDLVAQDVGIVDWVKKDDVKRQMLRRIKRQLASSGHANDVSVRMAQGVVEVLKAREGR